MAWKMVRLFLIMDLIIKIIGKLHKLIRWNILHETK